MEGDLTVDVDAEWKLPVGSSVVNSWQRLPCSQEIWVAQHSLMLEVQCSAVQHWSALAQGNCDVDLYLLEV